MIDEREIEDAFMTVWSGFDLTLSEVVGEFYQSGASLGAATMWAGTPDFAKSLMRQKDAKTTKKWDSKLDMYRKGIL